ncbi:MAG: hypothetical protein R3B40_26725 [Polyangiales bacterium]|nr:hypothetical protein [Myxococcales bacterium]MCB9656061.1 hypothetical protein [Sandaracinaceae bacterium]
MTRSRSPFVFVLTVAVGLTVAALGCDSGSMMDGEGDPSCPTGTLECPCSSTGGCGLDAEGELLQCVAGVCLLPTCPVGTIGCECTLAGRCTSSGAQCSDGLCVNANCTPGEEGCACANGISCGVGLFCRAGTVCVDQTGFEGGECLANMTCNPGARCDPAQERCIYCDRGTEGCHCTELGVCDAGLSCAAGMCVSRNNLPPADPACYTPCRRDLGEGASRRVCDADGLLAGCIDDQTCDRGSCVQPGQTKPTCTSDVDCPFFQACLGGGCYSNCETNLDCPGGRACYQRVCRVPCSLTTGSARCPLNESCDSRDGQTGYCVPVAPPPDEPIELPSGGALSIDIGRGTEFTSLRTSGNVVLRNAGEAQTVTIRKLSHTITMPNGATETVELAPDRATGAPLPCGGASVDCPLWWLELGTGSSTTRMGSFDVEVPGNCDNDCPSISIGNTQGSPGVRYEGRILVSGPGGSQEFTLRYAEDASGRWEGQVHYFTDFHDEGLDEWLERDDRSDVTDVENALIQRWGAFRRGNLESWDEFQAVLTATRTGSWQQPRVQELCDAVTGGSANAVCYPYSNRAGVRVYVQDANAARVPSATTELPMALHLRSGGTTSTILSGRVDSETALHYPNNPAVSIRLTTDPAGVGACDPAVPGACVVYVQDLNIAATVGGRYVSDDGSCAAGYLAKTVPWLIPGFTTGVSLGGPSPRRTECRESTLPFLDDMAANVDFAGANPVPDGLTRQRRVEFLDGALVNQRDLFLLIRETFDGFLPSEPPVSTYAFAVLRRAPQALDEEDYVGNEVTVPTRNPPAAGFTCSADLTAGWPPSVVNDPDRFVRTLIEGSAAASTEFGLQEIPQADTPAQIHYLCDGLFDGGGALEVVSENPNGPTAPDGNGYFAINGGAGGYNQHLPVACSPGAEVTFFYTGTAMSEFAVINHGCQATASCDETLAAWTGTVARELDPTFLCINPNQVRCDDDITDLRDGKRFFRRTASSTGGFSLQSLASVVNEAFRYKTRFQSDLNVGTEVGFAPAVCGPNANQTPYCYDPAEIEHARARIDCLLSIYTNRIGELSPTVRTQLERFLRANHAQSASGDDGFERLYAELLVMLGDEELTQAFASRFDLAAVNTRDFEGAEFETDGINLSGVAGAEMSRLYAAVQYYQFALDRLYESGPHLDVALRRANTATETNFVSPQTVTLYLSRLVRASAQKALAWSEIAKRYRDFNNPTLARRVLERAYAQTYLESALLSRLMLAIAEQTGLSFVGQIQAELQQVQRTYRIAMLDMREVFEDIVRGATFFGYPPEYVPFPALDPNSSENGFESLLNIARQRLQIAKEREVIAFESLLSGAVDSAQFQSELTRVRNTYEDQLATACGTFRGSDGVTYPAIARYADRNELAVITGDPCGTFPNGTIYEQMLEVDAASAALEAVTTRYRNTVAEIEDEITRVSAQCGLIREQAEFEYNAGQQTRTLTRDLETARVVMGGVVRALNTVKDALDSYSGCLAATLPDGKISCGALATVAGVLGGVAAATETGAEIAAAAVEDEIAGKRLETARVLSERACEVQEIDSAPRTANLVRSLDEITLEALRAQVQLELQIAQVQRSYSEAQRLQERQREATQQLIDVEAARNDPNVRIFRNESIINADIAFDDAMRAAYRATRMFEYYTSTSYARLDELFLIRLAARGRPNLENYLTDLENAFQDFEEDLGLPDNRVAVLSLLDDILQIPFADEAGDPIAQNERIRMMQDILADPGRLDANGYITIPFGTDFSQLSPLTRNHKIRYIEANVVATDVGDQLGRIYLRQRGTSIIRTIDDQTSYFVFPVRTAVVDAIFNGSRVFAADVYPNYRHRDRPYAHTMWELVINQRDEQVNRDINLRSLSDIQLFIHYTDFTVF